MLLYHALSYHTGRHAISPYHDAFDSLFIFSSVVSAPMKRKGQQHPDHDNDRQDLSRKNGWCVGIHVGKGVDSSRICLKISWACSL